MASETKIGERETVDTGDVVFHEKSGEEWLVAYVKGDYLAWCGWPFGEAKVSDCRLVRKATPDAREKLLREIAAVEDGSDARVRYARQALSAPEKAGEVET